MKDFDEERALLPQETFRLGGREWVVRREVRPEVIFAFTTMPATVTDEDAMRIMDTLVVACLAPGDEAAWRELRDAEDEQVGLETIQRLVTWLIESVVARPTNRPSPSSRSPRATRGGTSSMGESPSLAAVASKG